MLRRSFDYAPQAGSDGYRMGTRAFSNSTLTECAIPCCAKKRNHFLFVFGRTIGKAHAHAAEPDSRDLQAALSRFAFLHFALHILSSRCWVPSPACLHEIRGRMGDEFHEGYSLSGECAY